MINKYKIKNKNKKAQMLNQEAVLVIVSIILIGLVNSAYMEVQSRADCSDNGGYPVMGLYSLVNAHGEIASEMNYNYVLCANYSGTATCDGTNKIVGL